MPECRKHILIIVGTRPEAIKMAPVISALRECRNFRVTVCASGQHKEMLEQALADFSLAPDEDLEAMTAGQTLAGLSGVLFPRVDALLDRLAPDWVLVQGDTTTVMVAALCAFYRNIAVGHVEAGLRTFNLRAPFPEELNRRVTAIAGTLHFAPTRTARDNLLREGIEADRIVWTGNTVVDALLRMREIVRQTPPRLPPPLDGLRRDARRIVLVTAHRRESFGEGLEHICDALRELAEAFPDTAFVYPVHRNPAVGESVRRRLAGRSGIVLSGPLSYKPFVALMDRADLILTDSGGIQEEATILRKPVLVMRETTERMEGVRAGAAVLVGTDAVSIVSETRSLLGSPERRESMSSASPHLYGDGRAAERIRDALARHCR